MSISFPKELANRKQWICWRLEPNTKDGRDSKIPYNPLTGRKASSTNPNDWSTLDDAIAAKEQYLYTGLGFVFAKSGGLVGIDIDHCRDKNTGELSDTAKDILERFPSYTEISPSGTGLHIFYKGEMPAKGNKNTKTGVEMYAHSRYFTMTGDRLPGTPDYIAEDNGALAWIHENYIKSKKRRGKSKKDSKVVKLEPLTDEEILEKARTAENHKEFDLLWEGKWQEAGYPSQSEADIALCCMLAFWSGKNKEQMDRLFRNSGLFREKWDTVHHASGATYGQETLDKAIEVTENVYSRESESVIFEHEGRYYRTRGESVYPITNFIIQPVEMIVSEDETQMTADLITIRDEIYRQTFMTTDFNNIQKFKNILNRRTISLGYFGSEGDLELLKGYISEMEWVRKTGVKALGIYEHGGRMVYVSTDGAIEAGGNIVEDIVQLDKYKSITTDILTFEPLTKKQLIMLGEWLLSYNEPIKTVSVMAWVAGCFIKPHLKKSGIKFPHLLLVGEQGSGKSNTLERVILPIFSCSKIRAATQVTAFTLMKESASSNLIPQLMDEFKPSKIDKLRLNALYNHLRDAYDGHEGVRGRADQSAVTYELLAPIIVAGEESPDEAAIRERSIELLFSKKDLKPASHRQAFYKLCAKADLLGSFGRSLLDTALRVSVAEAEKWYEEAKSEISDEFPSRIVNNLACCYAGLILVNKLCEFLNVTWSEVFPINKVTCIRYLQNGVQEYLLDGGSNNKTIVEQTLEIMARMKLAPNQDYTFDKDGKVIGIRFCDVYDRYTKYRRDYAITGECLPYNQFLKQLRQSDFFIESNKTMRFGNETKKAWALDFSILKERCDVSGFEITDIEPL